MTIREMEKGKEFNNFYAKFREISQVISPTLKGSSYHEQLRRFKGGLNSEQVQNFHFQALIVIFEENHKNDS